MIFIIKHSKNWKYCQNIFIHTQFSKFLVRIILSSVHTSEDLFDLLNGKHALCTKYSKIVVSRLESNIFNSATDICLLVRTKTENINFIN